MSKIYITLLKTSISLILTIMVFVRCSDFFESDITDEKVELISPMQNYKSSSATISFWWNEVDGAMGYRLQVASPTFDSVQTMIIDTSLTSTSYTLTLYPGRYQWAVSAYNNSSATQYFYRTLTIDTSNILSGTKVILRFPDNNFYSNKSKILFRWYTLETATRYTFDIRKDNEDGELVGPALTVTTDTISYTLGEGTYYWSLQAFNKVSASLVTSRKLTIDKTAPGTPVLVEPNDGDTLYTKNAMILNWRHSALSLAPINDSVIISKDSLFSESGIVEYARVDTIFYEMSLKDAGTYFWKVRSVDLAGNTSDYSKYRKLKVVKSTK